MVSSARGRRKIPAALFGPRFGARVWQITTPITAWSSFLSLHHGQGKGIESILTSIVLCLLGIGMLLAGPATMTDTIIGLWYTFSTVIMTEIPAPEEAAPSNRPARSQEHARTRAGHQPDQAPEREPGSLGAASLRRERNGAAAGHMRADGTGQSGRMRLADKESRLD